MQRSIPLGYEIRNGDAVIHELEGEMVKYAFENYCKGTSQLNIAKYFLKCEYKNGVGRISWTHTTIGNILKNEIYLGNGFYPPIITKEMFEKSTQVREAKAIHQKRYKNDDYEYREPLFAFSSKLYCETCDSVFYRFQVRLRNKKIAVDWKCKNQKGHLENGIDRPTVFEHEVEIMFVELLHELARDLIPLFKKPSDPIIIDDDIKKISNEITLLLNTQASAINNKEQLSKLITKRAHLQFERAIIDDFDYQTGKIKRMLADKNLMDKSFDPDFFRGVISKVTVDENTMICFGFLNGYKVYKQYSRERGLLNARKKC